ncbi:unnamed protein product [Allacma fusca]|uniref:Uncharacterized protein n=1 Tax=Allacma fusca TaxID=39272 RepID=A0A8J2K4U8_9HEXA|nr:unnamed protein product [Allacma fusca]
MGIGSQFVQSDDGRAKKEYEYTMATPEYVSWHVMSTKQGIRETHTSLVFTGRPFLSAVDVAERRNLIYNFKSLLRRDPKGRLIAGLYFKVNSSRPTITMFYMENNNRVDVKLNIVRNFKETDEIRNCEEQMGLKKGSLIQKLNTIGRSINDLEFVSQVVNLEEKISSISAEN